MKRIIDNAALLTFCLGSLFFLAPDDAFLVSLLAAILFFSLTVKTKRWVGIASSLLWTGLCFFNRDFTLFMPVVAYYLFQDQLYIMLVALLLCTVFLTPLPLSAYFFFTISGSALAYLLQLRTDTFETLHSNMLQLRDEKIENDRLLVQRDRSILARQNSDIYAATLQERNRIAREIHDNVGHMLARAILIIGAMKAVPKTEPTDMLLELEHTLTTAMTSIRESVHDLRDQALHLQNSIRELLDDFTFCETRLLYECGDTLPKELKFSFLAIIKEALSNIMAHSDATLVEITVREYPGLYQLVIEDNGSPAHNSTKEPGGMGLQNMKDRIHALDGNILLRRKQGFQIFITVPRKEEMK